MYHVTTEEEVQARLTEIRKKHYGANHHCYAYVLGENRDKVKCSDDGEPQKTAGVPILSVIQGEEATDTLIIVTRYFGGTLLGTGGLVRAYTNAAQEGLKAACVFEKRPAKMMKLRLQYDDYNRVQRFLTEGELKPSDTSFTDIVTVSIPVPDEKKQSFEIKITDLTQSRAIMEYEEDVFYAEVGGKIHLFES